MQLITTRNKEISFAELKKAISSGDGLELIRPGDKFTIELKNGEHVNAVCGGYVNEKRARFVLEDCLADKWRMNDTPTNKGGYLKSEGRRHVLEDILPLFPDELAEAFEPRFLSEEIDGERYEYADIAELVVREEADVKKISRELYNMQKSKSRSKGVSMA